MATEDDFQSGSSDEELEMTAGDVLRKLEEAWLNEKFSPELLETKVELVECMLEQIKQMEDNLRKCKKGDFRIIVHKMEIDRIRYILSSYLRIRLGKIEKYVHHVLQQESSRDSEAASRLSMDELTFAKDYAGNMDTHFKDVVLRHMPPNLQMVDKNKTTAKPNTDSYVFLRANEKKEQVLVEPEMEDDQNAEVIDLEKEAQYIMRYQPIASLVASGCVTLI